MAIARVAPPPMRNVGPMMKPAKLGLEEPQEQIIRKIRITPPRMSKSSRKEPTLGMGLRCEFIKE
ncbi:unnamed protein product [Prunus brigantina]